MEMSESPSPYGSNNSSQNTSVAPVACAMCYRKKRKCDRTLPSCSRCIKSRNDCIYPAIQGTLPTATIDVSLTPLDQAGGSDLDLGIKNEVLQTLQELSLNALEVVRNYVALINPWLPIINLSRLNSRLDTIQQGRSSGVEAETTALLLFMQLVTQSSSNERTHNSDLQRKVYRQCQSIFALLQTFRRAAVETRQCGVLLTTYQLGAGFVLDAYVTLSTTSGLIRVNQTCPFASERRKDESDDETRKLWWGVFLLDRLIAQSHRNRQHYPLIVDQPPLWAELPSGEGSKHISIRIEDMGPCHCEYFCREVQAAYLAGQALQYNRDSDSGDKEGRDFSLDTVAMQLMALLNTLFENASGSWRPYCGAIATVIIATLDLYLPVSKSPPGKTELSRLASSMEALATTIRINTEIVANSLSDDDDQEYHDRLPITGVIASHRTALAICHRAELNQALTTEDRYGLMTMTRALQRGRVRWGLADVYLQEIMGMLDNW